MGNAVGLGVCLCVLLNAQITLQFTWGLVHWFALDYWYYVKLEHPMTGMVPCATLCGIHLSHRSHGGQESMMYQPLGQRHQVNNGPEKQCDTPSDSKTRNHVWIVEKT